MKYPIKKVDVDCCEPIAFNKGYEQGWSDVYISYDGKPGRKRYHYGLTLISISDVETELELRELLNARSPHDRYKNNIDQLNAVLVILRSCGIVIIDADSPTPSVYTSRSSINHDEAELMIRFFMEMKGYSRVRLRWRRPKHGMTIIPTSFSSSSIE